MVRRCMPTFSSSSRVLRAVAACMAMGGGAVIGCASGTEPVSSAFLPDTVVIAGNFREAGSASESPLRAAVDLGLQLTNESARPETLVWSDRGTCDAGIVARAWRMENGKQVLVWHAPAMAVVPCPGHALPIVIAPHSTVQLGTEIESAELLGDSLPVDTYRFTVSADLASPSLTAEVATPPVLVSTQFIVPPGTVLDGTWTGEADGILLTLPLHWTADSVTGTGTYQTLSPNTNRCGGGTLTGSGSVTLRASRTSDGLSGTIAFDNGWTPPYSAVLTGVGELDGGFMSIDAGTSRMELALETS